MWLNGFLDDTTSTSKRKKLTGLKNEKKLKQTKLDFIKIKKHLCFKGHD